MRCRASDTHTVAAMIREFWSTMASAHTEAGVEPEGGDHLSADTSALFDHIESVQALFGAVDTDFWTTPLVAVAAVFVNSLNSERGRAELRAQHLSLRDVSHKQFDNSSQGRHLRMNDTDLSAEQWRAMIGFLVDLRRLLTNCFVLNGQYYEMFNANFAQKSFKMFSDLWTYRSLIEPPCASPHLVHTNISAPMACLHAGAPEDKHHDHCGNQLWRFLAAPGAAAYAWLAVNPSANQHTARRRLLRLFQKRQSERAQTARKFQARCMEGLPDTRALLQKLKDEWRAWRSAITLNSTRINLLQHMYNWRHRAEVLVTEYTSSYQGLVAQLEPLCDSRSSVYRDLVQRAVSEAVDTATQNFILHNRLSLGSDASTPSLATAIDSWYTVQLTKKCRELLDELEQSVQSVRVLLCNDSASRSFSAHSIREMQAGVAALHSAIVAATKGSAERRAKSASSITADVAGEHWVATVEAWVRSACTELFDSTSVEVYANLTPRDRHSWLQESGLRALRRELKYELDQSRVCIQAARQTAEQGVIPLVVDFVQLIKTAGATIADVQRLSPFSSTAAFVCVGDETFTYNPSACELRATHSTHVDTASLVDALQRIAHETSREWKSVWPLVADDRMLARPLRGYASTKIGQEWQSIIRIQCLGAMSEARTDRASVVRNSDSELEATGSAQRSGYSAVVGQSMHIARQLAYVEPTAKRRKLTPQSRSFSGNIQEETQDAVRNGFLSVPTQFVRVRGRDNLRTKDDEFFVRALVEQKNHRSGEASDVRDPVVTRTESILARGIYLEQVATSAHADVLGAQMQAHLLEFEQDPCVSAHITISTRELIASQVALFVAKSFVESQKPT